MNNKQKFIIEIRIRSKVISHSLYNMMHVSWKCPTPREWKKAKQLYNIYNCFRNGGADIFFFILMKIIIKIICAIQKQMILD